MRAALHGILREGREEAYEREHAVVWRDLLAALLRVGIREWIIWRSGRDLFHLVEADDFDRAVADLEHDPANERWQATWRRSSTTSSPARTAPVRASCGR